MNQEEIIVDDYISDPQFINENDENPELYQLIIDSWNLESAIYAILIGHGITVPYLKILDEKALDDIFSVAKWTGHKHALRMKLCGWEESVLFRQTPHVEANQTNCVAIPGRPGTSKHKLLPTSVTYSLLDDILQRNEKGKIVTRYYETHKSLDSEHRKYLAHTIVDYYIANHIYFALPDMARFAQLISERFSPEISVIHKSNYLFNNL
ncbi:uncharacterized protein LOC131692500 [Topomyia yanbarensis]|uniref:uncharacterized protein LOC131692500 n=1 Tax=Topomyia yanbarensis TaxID=2498891 RepID=UPI00273C9850|nr:uncharacterized protein LOC131692500 [Topomyia yanbarensis]